VPHSVSVIAVLPPATGNTEILFPIPVMFIYVGKFAGIIAPTFEVSVAGALIA
jgi:hypothetical protein